MKHAKHTDKQRPSLRAQAEAPLLPKLYQQSIERVIIDIESAWKAVETALNLPPAIPPEARMLQVDYLLSRLKSASAGVGRRKGFKTPEADVLTPTRFLEAQTEEAFANFASHTLSHYAKRVRTDPSLMRVLDVGDGDRRLTHRLCTTVREVYFIGSVEHGTPGQVVSDNPDNLQILPCAQGTFTPDKAQLGVLCQVGLIHQGVITREFQAARELIEWTWESLDRDALLIIALPGAYLQQDSQEVKSHIARFLCESDAFLERIRYEMVFEANSEVGVSRLEELRSVLPRTAGEEEGQNRCCYGFNLLAAYKGEGRPTSQQAEVGLQNTVLEISLSPDRPVSSPLPRRPTKAKKAVKPTPDNWRPNPELILACRNLSKITPAHIVQILDGFQTHDVARYDGCLGKSLSLIGVPRVIYYEWIRDEQDIRNWAGKEHDLSWEEIKAKPARWRRGR
ncbi:MAG: hypothetical protein GX589_03280 [Deltaproteobacteria bacterium]|nr:hypothetical protein [Deltaproteobacteria bacterium]